MRTAPPRRPGSSSEGASAAGGAGPRSGSQDILIPQEAVGRPAGGPTTQAPLGTMRTRFSRAPHGVRMATQPTPCNPAWTTAPF
ncbi:Sorting Nexin-1 [Manis pentadactyla]|nr:Sorting Nexin-1 [Manis pentadactyla]